MVKQKYVLVNQDIVKKVGRFLSRPFGLPEANYQGDKTISVTVNFGNGMSMDIQCCGSRSEPSWTQAILFKNGQEVVCSQPRSNFLGQWYLQYGNNLYVANVIEKCRMTEMAVDAIEKANHLPYGLPCIDADTILVDLVNQEDMEETGIGEGLIALWLKSCDRDSVQKVFELFTGTRFSEYLQRCTEETTVQTDPHIEVNGKLIRVLEYAKDMLEDGSAYVRMSKKDELEIARLVSGGIIRIEDVIHCFSRNYHYDDDGREYIEIAIGEDEDLFIENIRLHKECVT